MTPTSLYTLHWGGPAAPRLVRISTTPLAASVPYSVEAEGPLTISIDSISSGLRSFRRLGLVPPIPMLDPVWQSELALQASGLFPTHFKPHKDKSRAGFQLAMFGRTIHAVDLRGDGGQEGGDKGERSIESQDSDDDGNHHHHGEVGEQEQNDALHDDFRALRARKASVTPDATKSAPQICSAADLAHRSVSNCITF